MRLSTILGSLLVVVPSLAIASPVLHAPGTARPGDLVASAPDSNGLTFVRKLLPANGHIAAPAESRTIYLNRHGVTLRPGDDDSRMNTSSIISGQATVPAWNTSDANWNATVSCFRDLWSRFDVTITDVDPGSVPHMEAVFGGYPQNVGMGQGVGGVSPFTDDCGVIENSIVFTFTEVFPDDPRVICEVMAQEVAHSYGLDHEMLASDPMTYLDYTGNRAFADQTVACGEYSNRACGIGGSTCRPNQNSVALLKLRAGTADSLAPTLDITAPQDAATVAVGFEVDATAMDNIGVTMATLTVDGQPAGTITGAGPFVFPTADTLAAGSHMISVEVTDGRNVSTKTIAVTIGSGDGTGSNGSDGSDGSAGGDPTSNPGDVAGGCATGGGAGLAFALVGLAGLVFARRRRL